MNGIKGAALVPILSQPAGGRAIMSTDIAEALREQARRVTKIAERAAADDVRQELAAVASALAQLAEVLAWQG